MLDLQFFTTRYSILLSQNLALDRLIDGSALAACFGPKLTCRPKLPAKISFVLLLADHLNRQ